MKKFDYFEVADEGKIKSVDTLYEDAVEAVVDALECLDYDEALDLGNEYRDKCGYDRLYRNEEDSLNEALDGLSPYDILSLSWDYCPAYFTWDGWDLNTTDDPWEGFDIEDLARSLIDGDSFDFVPREVQAILDEYEEVVEYAENYNEYRAEGEALLEKYTNCEADVTDLLQYISRITKNDEVWKEEE